MDSAEWDVLHPGCHPHEARGQALPKPRRHASMVVHGGSLFVYGGFDVDDNVLSDFWEFRVGTATWNPIPLSSPSPAFTYLPDPLGVRRPHVPVARAEHTAVVDGNRMIVFGGYDGKKKLNDTYVFDFASRQWFRPSNAECNAPSRRCKHSAVLYKRRMYVVGGFQFNDGDNYALTDMHVLDLDTFAWSSLIMGNSSPEALQGHKAVVCGDSMYIVGGKVRVRSRFSLSASQSATAVAAGAANHGLPIAPATIGGAGYVPGGDGNPNSGAFIGMPNISTIGGISENPASMSAAAAAAAAMLSNGGLGNGGPASDGGIAVGGNGAAGIIGNNPANLNNNVNVVSMDNRGSGLNGTVFRYTFETNRWSGVETIGPMPIPRQLHAAVTVAAGGGGRMSIFLFGGTDRAKQRFFSDLCELRGIRTSAEEVRQACETCNGTKSLLDNPIFSDVTFIVEGKSIHAHRCILYARAEYFRNMFDSKMRESSQKEIAIPDVAYDVFRAVLEYIYSGSVQVSNDKLSVELLKAADMFRIEGLRTLCVEKVEQAVTVENAALICQVADMHNAVTLKQFCITFMMHNFKEVIRSTSFQNLMRQDPGGLGHEILEAYSENNGPSAGSGAKRPRK